MVRKPKRGKRVNIKLMNPDDSGSKPFYKILRTLIKEHHEDLAGAKIALAWAFGWKQDRDQRMTLGKCTKASDLQKEFADYDFVISLNHAVVTFKDFGEKRITALIDHELCHAAPVIDKNSGDQVKDERDRLCWRIRKHDIEEFREIVERHGCYKGDLEEFGKACAAAMGQPLLNQPAAAKPEPKPASRRSATWSISRKTTVG